MSTKIKEPHVIHCPFCGNKLDESKSRYHGNHYSSHKCSNKECPTYEFEFIEGSDIFMSFDIQLG